MFTIGNPYVLGGMVALALWAAVLTVLFVRLVKRVRRFFNGASGETLEARIANELARMERIEKNYKEIARGLEMLNERLAGAVQRVGLVRFNAIPEMKGDQSFALALLDAEKSGVILLSLLTREGMRIYAKQITSGKAAHALTPEEEQAMAEAMKN